MQDTIANDQVARAARARLSVWGAAFYRFNRLSLASQFLLVSFGVLATGVLVVGASSTLSCWLM